jgi:hypothetical protein
MIVITPSPISSPLPYAIAARTAPSTVRAGRDPFKNVLEFLAVHVTTPRVLFPRALRIAIPASISIPVIVVSFILLLLILLFVLLCLVLMWPIMLYLIAVVNSKLQNILIYFSTHPDQCLQAFGACRLANTNIFRRAGHKKNATH